MRYGLKGETFSNHIADWTTYLNFEIMYNEVYKENGQVWSFQRTSPPISDGQRWENPCQQRNMSDVFVFRVTHRLLYPDISIIIDEVGGNTSHKVDGHIGGEIHLFKRLLIP